MMSSAVALREFPDDVLPPEGQYGSCEEVRNAINAWAAPRGYAFITKRSTTLPNGRRIVTYICDRGGGCRPLPTAEGAPKGQRDTASRRTGCPFSVTASQSASGIWTSKHRIKPEFCQHNHEPSFNQRAHPTHRQLSTDNALTVQRLASAGVAPGEISSYLHLNSNTIATRKDITNCIAKGKRLLAQGQSNIHALAEQP